MMVLQKNICLLLRLELKTNPYGHGFEHLGLTRVVAEVDEPNIASPQVLEKLGMKFEKTVQYSERRGFEYAITSEGFVKSAHFQGGQRCNGQRQRGSGHYLNSKTPLWTISLIP